MAEQINHNVVNEPQSASVSALAGVAANQIDSVYAALGKQDTIPENVSTSDSSNDANLPTDALNAPVANSLLKTDAAFAAAEPSAGDAIGKATNDSKVTLQSGEEQNLQDGQAVAASDLANQGEGLADDSSAADISVDHSVHSDTDVNRVDLSEQQKEENHHVRTNSVKKPTAFSKVSVTKNFLAKAAAPTPQAVKPGEKPALSGAPTQLVAKPRLVAKTGSGLQNMQKARAAGENAGGPDASKVWNKNRPVPPPPPKQFTDEELKQQYGIHLATRLQTDESGKESKWADIDDDEDDWTPETVVWMDGTKSTLTPSDVPPIQPEQKTLVKIAKPTEAIKPTLTALKRPAETGPPKTILKPGIAVQQAKQQVSGASTTSTEKPSLKAKSPAPAPAKSPWAALPPIDAVSPVVPPTQQQAPSFTPLPTQDARAYDSQPQLPPLAREIAADTFDRSWREGEGGSRELFNSANGRYEPAPGGRRSSMKPDGQVRKPAVLQRPSQSGTTHAEPSAAFQTRTSSQIDGTSSYGRRRGSSFSQGSIPPGRRLSVSTRDAGLSPASERRESTIVGHDMRPSTQAARAEAPRPTFSQQSAWEQQMPARPEPGTEPEDPVKVQERVMREKRELAIKRRKDEEEKAEADKQARLKARLAALEGAGKSRKEREAEAAVIAPVASKVEEPTLPIPQPEPAVEAMAVQAQTKEPTPPAAVKAAVPAAPSEQTITKETIVIPEELPQKPQPTGSPVRSSSPTETAPRQAPRSHLSPRANARTPFGPQSSPYRQPSSSYSSPGERKSQPLGRSPLTSNDAFAPWGPTASNGNVWGSLGIGNGTFDKSNSFSPMSGAQHTSGLPPPPGMTRPPTSTRVSPQAQGQQGPSPIQPQQHSQPQPQQQAAEPLRPFPPPGIDSRTESTWGQGLSAGVSPAPVMSRQAHLPGPIAPPSRAQAQQQPQAQRPDPVSAWNSAAHRLPYQYTSEVQAAEAKAQTSGAPPPRDDTIKETFKQTSSQQGRLGGPRRYEKPEYTIHDAQGSRPVASLSPAPPNAQTQPSGPFSTASPLNELRQQSTENTVRIPDGSLNSAQGGSTLQQPPIAPPRAPSQKAPTYQAYVHFPTGPLAPMPGNYDQSSPPPPETSAHPVNSSNVGHPLVRLPQPLPIVKLPPMQMLPVAPQTPSMFPQRIQHWGPGPKPLVMNEDWQARFNGLFGRVNISTETPPSPPKTPPKAQSASLAVTSSSRGLLEEGLSPKSATVSLPRTKRRTTVEGFTIDDSQAITSKATIDDIFNEERSMGSLPLVHIPDKPGYPLRRSTSDPLYNLLDPFFQMSAPIDASYKPEPVVERLFTKNPAGYFLKLPGTSLNNRLVRHQGDSRKSVVKHDRKTSGKVARASHKDSTPGSPSATVNPNAATLSPHTPGSRSASMQKGKASSSASPAKQGNSMQADNGRRKAGWKNRVPSVKAS